MTRMLIPASLAALLAVATGGDAIHPAAAQNTRTAAAS